METIVTRIDFTRAIAPPEDGSPRPWTVTKRHGVDVLAEETKSADWDLDEALDWLSEHGWVVAKWRPSYLIRAWRGDNLPVTRMDFRRVALGIRVQKWLAGWHASTKANEDYIRDDVALWDVKQWLKEHGPRDHDDWDGWRWTEVPGFIRAWLGPKMPVRNAGQIKRMRIAFDDWHKAVKVSGMYGGQPMVTQERPEWLPQVMDPDQVPELDLAYVL
ncbi:hypothetical protein GF348_24550 [candidate division KSB3 bacterium]|nr:hypothetical protein [candidate division KSB3 bacterium]